MIFFLIVNRLAQVTLANLPQALFARAFVWHVKPYTVSDHLFTVPIVVSGISGAEKRIEAKNK